MDKPRIFLGSSGKQEKLLQALTRGLEGVAHVDPWTTSFHPGTTTLDRLLELAHEVDFATFVFAPDDSTSGIAGSRLRSGFSASQRRLQAGPFGGALGLRRSFILHASDSTLPSDLSGSRALKKRWHRQCLSRLLACPMPSPECLQDCGGIRGARAEPCVH